MAQSVNRKVPALMITLTIWALEGPGFMTRRVTFLNLYPYSEEGYSGSRLALLFIVFKAILLMGFIPLLPAIECISMKRCC